MMYAQWINALETLRDEERWLDFAVHESVVCRELNIQATEGQSTRERLTSLLTHLSIGLVVGFPAIDLTDPILKRTGDNNIGIRISAAGSRERFAGTTLKGSTNCVPRYFIFGENQVNILQQQKIIRFATGNNTTSKRVAISEEIIRRRSAWLSWYNNDMTDKAAIQYE